MATVAEQVQQIYIGLLGRAADQAGATYWEEQISTGAITLDEMRANFVNNQAEYAAGLGQLSRADAVIELYNRMFERAPETDGATYWTTGAGSSVPIDQLSITFMEAALADDITALTNKTAAATAYTAAAGSNYSAAAALTAIDSVDSTAASLAASLAATDTLFPGQVFTLTENRDVLTGTDANDTFFADVGQNSLGAVSNSLASGDIVDGGAGYDTLTSTLISDSVVDTDENTQSPLPRLNNIEEVRVQALADVTLDADHITAESKYASDSSRADLIITNVDIEATQITKDIKLEMKDTQQFSDFEVYFNEQDLKAAPDVTVGSASVTIQVADGAQASTTTTPLINMTFDLSFTQGAGSFSFDDIESTDGTYAGLVTAIQVAFAAEGLTQYEVSLDGEFTSFDTGTKSIDLDYTGSFITIKDNNQNEFADINFAPQQKAGSAVAILLAQSEVNAEQTTSSFLVESDITVDNVGRGSNGGEIVIGSTSASDSSTGVERINVIVENSSVISDISSTNDALKHITLTNGTVKGDFVLANADFDGADTDNVYTNVDQANLVKEGLTSIVATDFDGDIVLGRDANLVDLGTLSAAVNGDVTYNATLNDKASYTATTGNGADTLDITLVDSIVEANGETDTSVTISTGAANDSITVDEADGSSEITTAVIGAGTGDDVIRGNDVSVTVEAGAGNDVVYAENTGSKALLTLDTATLFTAATPATNAAATVHPAGAELSLLAGKQVQVTIATDGIAATLLGNGYESSVVSITAAEGTLTTIDDLNAAVLKAVNEDSVLNKIVVASVDENNDVVITYLVDGVQDDAAISLEITDPAAQTSVTTAMLNEYRDFINDSTYTSAALITNWNTAAATTLASVDSFVGSTITVTTASTQGDVVSVTIDGKVISLTIDTDTPTAITDASEIAAALVEAGYAAVSDGVSAVHIVTEDENLAASSTGTTVFAVADTVVLAAASGTLIGTNSVDNDNINEINGNSGDDVIVLSSDGTVADTVVFTEYNQGNDTIVHFATGTDELDFTSYLTGTVDGANNGSSSTESEVALPNTSSITEVFTANSINLLDFNDLDGIATGVTFENATAAQIEAALNADASMSVAASTNGIYQSKATSVLIIEDDVNATAAVVGDIQNDGTYKAYQVTYNDTAVAAVAGGTAGTYTVTLIGGFDLGDDAHLAVGDLTLV